MREICTSGSEDGTVIYPAHTEPLNTECSMRPINGRTKHGCA
jgi:hypothetical protein